MPCPYNRVNSSAANFKFLGLSPCAVKFIPTWSQLRRAEAVIAAPKKKKFSRARTAEPPSNSTRRCATHRAILYACMRKPKRTVCNRWVHSRDSLPLRAPGRSRPHRRPLRLRCCALRARCPPLWLFAVGPHHLQRHASRTTLRRTHWTQHTSRRRFCARRPPRKLSELS